MRVFSLEQAAAEVGDDDFGDDDDGEDGQQDDGDAIPFKEFNRRLHDHADAAGADQAEDGGFAHVDVPAQQHDGPKGRFDGWPVAVEDLAALRRARRFQRFDAAARDFFQRLAEQFADEADGAAGDGDGARQRAGAKDGDEEQRPDERVDGAAGDEQGFGEEVEGAVGCQVVRGEDGQRQRGDEGEQGAKGGDVEGFQQRRVDFEAVVGVVGRVHPLHHVQHLFRRVPEKFPDDVDVLQRQRDGDADAQPEGGADEFFGERVPLPEACGVCRGVCVRH